MLPAGSITTLPWVGPIDELPSGRSPHPGTVSKVIDPLPIRTGRSVGNVDSPAVGSAAKTVAADRAQSVKNRPIRKQFVGRASRLMRDMGVVIRWKGKKKV